MTSRPTRGIDHIGITVPNLDIASRFFEQAFDAIPLYDNITRAQEPMQGAGAEKQLDLAPGTTLIAMRMMKLAQGPGLEVFEMKGPEQHKAARPSDFGLQHFAVYVDDMKVLLRRFTKAGGSILSGPSEMLGLEKGTGNIFAYLRISLREFRKIFLVSEEIRNRLLEFVQNEALTIIQIAGCHRLHGTEERMCRWLLMVQDRVETED